MNKLLAVLLLALASPAWAVDCKVGVYGGTPNVTGGPVQVALTLLDTLKATNVVASTAATSSGNSTGRLPVATQLVRVKCDGAAHFLIVDSSGTAVTTDDQDVEANAVEYFGATAGQYIKFIAGS
jgi:hypothetical protein